LTLGRPALVSGGGDLALLKAAARLAANSRHPLAQALMQAAPPVAAASGVEEQPGLGLLWRDDNGGEWRLGRASFCGVTEARQAAEAAQGPQLWFAGPGLPAHCFHFEDRLRPDAAAVVKRLAAQGLAVELLSGDRSASVAGVARSLGIGRWQAELTPDAKVARLEALAAEGRKVLMVGDGLNDAPALAAAHVSLSPTTAADISQTAADLLFQGERLGPVLEVLAVARRAQRLVRQNFVLAIGYNLIAVPLAVAGYVTPLIAAVCMSASSLIVTGNSLRLAWRRGRALAALEAGQAGAS
jgi:Cu2+-exporting ATPase